MTDEMDKTTTIPVSKAIKKLLYEEGRMGEQWNQLMARLINEIRMWREVNDIYRWDCGNVYTLRSSIYLLKRRLATYNPDWHLNDILNPCWIPSHNCPEDLEEIFRERIITIDRADTCLVWMPGDELEVFTFEQIRNGEHNTTCKNIKEMPVDSIEDTEDEKED